MKYTEDGFTKEEWDSKLGATQGFCPKCRKNVGIEKLSVDHVFPRIVYEKLKQNHIYSINEVQPLCKSCNSQKGTEYQGFTDSLTFNLCVDLIKKMQQESSRNMKLIEERMLEIIEQLKKQTEELKEREEKLREREAQIGYIQ